MLCPPVLLWGGTHCVLCLDAMLLAPGCNLLPNELSSLVISDGHQSARWMLGLTHGLVLRECLKDGLLTLVGDQLEPAPVGEVLCNGEAIDYTTITRNTRWTTQVGMH
jgi:hypothetical protein